MNELNVGDWVEITSYYYDRNPGYEQWGWERELFTPNDGTFYQVTYNFGNEYTLGGLYHPSSDAKPDQLWWFRASQLKKVDEFVVKLKEITDDNSNNGQRICRDARNSF